MIDARPETPATGVRPLTILGDPSAVTCEGDACLVSLPETTPGQ